jgi:hypothetical protein
MFPDKTLPNVRTLLAIVLVFCAAPALHSQFRGEEMPKPPQNPEKAHPVRNDAAQSGQEIVTLRYIRIKNGTFDQFLKTTPDIDAYTEKMGVRPIGVWKVVQAEGVEGVAKPSNDYDEIYLVTRYASIDHWKATRDPVSMGGNGPDWEKYRRALALRQSLIISTSLTFLQGAVSANRPLFMPGLNETYEKKP